MIAPAAWPPAHGGRIVAGLGGYQKFDSLAVDDTGHIYVATAEIDAAIAELDA